jgi:hypothetical protein
MKAWRVPEKEHPCSTKRGKKGGRLPKKPSREMDGAEDGDTSSGMACALFRTDFSCYWPVRSYAQPPTSNNSYQKIAFMATHAIILARKKIFTKFGHVTLRGMQARMFDFSLLKSSD